MIEITISGKILINYVRVAPTVAPTILGVSFVPDPLGGLDPMAAALLGTVHLSVAAPDVTSRPTVITFADGHATTVDYMNPALTFACNEGDTGTVVAIDVNAAGKSLPSAPFAFTAAPKPPPPPPLGVPVTPTILDVSFAVV